MVACVALAALSLLVLGVSSGADAWAWSVWGREILSLDLDPTNGPSWKPLPVLFTTPLALFGDAAPALWAVVARAGALLLLVLAFRLGSRLAGPLAGAFATLALVATDLADYAASADSEPLTAALLLGAFERHLDARRGQALGLLAVAALGRPEAWPLLLVYAAFLCVREPPLRLAVIPAVVLAPALWLGPPWLATGEALSAGSRANRLTEASLAAADVPMLAVVGLMLELVALPVLAGAIVAIAAAAAALSGRARGAGLRAAAAALWLAAAIGAWVVLVGILAQLGFTGNERYLAPAVAATCVLGGVGAAVIAHVIGAGSRPRTAITVVVLVALAAPFGLERARNLAGFRAEASERARTIATLDEAVARAGGPARVLACGGPAVARPGTQGTLAWYLGVGHSKVERAFPPEQERLALSPPSVVFSRAERRFNLVAQRERLVAPGLEIAPLTGRRRGWQAFVVTQPGEARARVARCRAN